MRTQRFAGPDGPFHQAPVEKKTQDALPPGTEILGKYVVERTLGSGGMGFVVAARHKGLGRLDAIKFLLPQMVTDEKVMERFEREARAAAKLTSPHVTRVFDYGFTDASEPYIVMEYLEGRDLKSVLRGGPLPNDKAVEYLLQVCHALTEAHENGIVHRDLKPANLFLTFPKNAPPLVKVLDFGIAKVTGPEDQNLTITDAKGGILGTIPYMSPEHLKGASGVDARTDIWALGVIAYEFFTCRKPFNGLTRMDLMSKILDKDEHPEPPSLHRPDMPLAIEMVIGRCLAKSREARFQTVQEFAAALREAAGIPAAPPMRAPMASISTSAAVAFPLGKGEETQASVGVTKAPVSRVRGRGALLAAAAGVMATVGTVAAMQLVLRNGGESAGVNASPVPMASISAGATPLVMSGPSVSAVQAVEVPSIEFVEPEIAVSASIGETNEKSTPALGIRKTGLGGKANLPPSGQPVPPASAPPQPMPSAPPSPTPKGTAVPTFIPPPSPTL